VFSICKTYALIRYCWKHIDNHFIEVLFHFNQCRSYAQWDSL
jgi:hypothetical protein